MTLDLARRLILWLSFSVGFGLLPFVTRVVAAGSSWNDEIYHGELLLMAAGILASAVGYSAVTTVAGRLDLIKVLIVAPGTILLTGIVLSYAFVHERSNNTVPADRPTQREVAALSYPAFAAAALAGLGGTYLAYRESHT